MKWFQFILMETYQCQNSCSGVKIFILYFRKGEDQDKEKGCEKVGSCAPMSTFPM